MNNIQIASGMEQMDNKGGTGAPLPQGGGGASRNDGILNFLPKGSDTRFIQHELVKVKPSHTITDATTVFNFFYLPPIEPAYMAINNLQLMLVTELWKRKTDGTWCPVVEADNVSVSPSLQDTIWSSVEVSLNGTPVIGDANKYHHITSHLFRALSLGDKAHSTYMISERVFPTDGHEDPDEGLVATATLKGAEGFQYRRNLYKAASGTEVLAPRVTSFGPLLTDLTTAESMLVGNVKLHLRLTRCPSAINVFTARPNLDTQIAEWAKDEVFELRIKDVTLFVPTYTLSEPSFVHHQKILANNDVTYNYFTRTTVEWLSIPTDVMVHETGKLFSSRSVPVKVFVLFYEEDRLLGNFKKNIHAYRKPRHLTSVTLVRNYQPVEPILLEAPSGTDYDMFLYTTLFKTLQTYYSNGGPRITVEEFKKYFYVVAHDLTASGFAATDTMPLIHTGNLTLKFTFSQKPVKVYNCLVVGLSPAFITCDKDRNVQVTYRGNTEK